ncbi:shieldin complex subunit 2 isoform X2 [Thunnus albacares]|uniref:shieldin complex subunit 2 isoform X2 n=1 Tax=Thunnus albacares TaxID=8236 RepID=UPI001CF6338D|nr:shieldin complex subunit 2 isoform X2 [Thunnus albacares]
MAEAAESRVFAEAAGDVTEADLPSPHQAAMCDRPRIHVFLGAPPPSSDPDGVSEAGLDGEERPPAGWRHLELTWRDGRLRPAADEAGNQVRLSAEEERTDRENVEAHHSMLRSRRQDDQTNTDLDDDWTKETPRRREGREGRATSGGTFNSEKENQCSASVHEYLDGCFPAAQPEPEPPRCPKHQDLSVRTQYLTTWTLSQALILRGGQDVQSASSPEKTPPSVSSSTPELFSPATPSPGAPTELSRQSRPTPRVEEGGVVLQATSDGVLCSQEAERHDSPSKSPDFKKARLSEYRTEATTGPRGAPTLLVHCDKVGGRYSVLVAVVHPCQLKEVKVKSGPSAGTFVPLASIVVTDQSAVEMKVVLWRRAAFWAVTVSPGDVLLITELQVSEDRWRGETLLQSTFSSKLLNLGQIAGSASLTAPQQVDTRALSCLCGFLRERRPLLVSLPHHPPQELNRLPYATLRSLQVNTLVHALLRVKHTHTCTEWRGEAESRCRSALQLQAVVTVEQPDGQQGALLLWGAAVDWLPRFNRDREAVWDLRFLLVREGLTSDLPELHSTPWSTVRPLDAADRRAQDFLLPPLVRTRNCSSLELDLDTLLSQKYSGEVELRVQVIAFQFQDSQPSQNAPQQVLDSCTPLAGIVVALSGDITYTGCGRCSAELDTDANGIYGPCYPCLPHTAVRRYYRPGVLTVSGRGSSQVCVQVPPVPLQNILNAPPDKLHRSSAPGSQVKLIQVAAERIQTLLCLPRKTFIITVRSHFLCDENSVPVTQDFTLLDIQFPPDTL